MADKIDNRPMTVTAAKDALGVSKSTIHNYITEGYLTKFEVNGDCTLVTAESVRRIKQAWEEGRQAAGAPAPA